MKNIRTDKFAQKARQEGYFARSAYKLLDIQKKYKIIRSGDVVLDIGAAPGSWLQVASELVGEKGRAIGIDLNPIRQISKNVQTFVGDITKPECKEKIISLIKKADVILCDIAPNTTGVIATDQYASTQLSEASFEIARDILRKGGKFICKVFQGPGFDQFYLTVRKQFKYCTTIKPIGSRKASKEIYIVARGFGLE